MKRKLIVAALVLMALVPALVFCAGQKEKKITIGLPIYNQQHEFWQNIYTTAKAYRLKLSDLLKIRSECVGSETPAFQITFMSPNLIPLDEWVLIPYQVWRRHAATQNR
jgi:hypothetical protein